MEVSRNEVEKTAPVQPITREEAVRLLSEARRLYDLADTVHGRRVPGGVDSAVLAHRALSTLFELLARLRGGPVPADFETLSQLAQTLAKTESLLDEDMGDDLGVIEDTRTRYVQEAKEATPAEARRYDRAFVRASAWFEAADKYLEQRLPAPESALRKYAISSLGAAGVFLLGFAVGRHVHDDAPRAPGAEVPIVTRSASAPTEPLVPVGPSFTATFFRDMSFQDVALTRKDGAIAFDWASGAPADAVPRDHFSARWEATLDVKKTDTYTFFLASDDGSRLFVDGSSLIDNWGGHAMAEKSAQIDLGAGPHALRVDYYDDIGLASVKLEWSGGDFERRLVTNSDLR